MKQRGDDRRVVSISAAAIYSGAAFVGIVESLLPGGEEFSVLPAACALAAVGAADLRSARSVPRLALAALGPLGAAMIGVAIATTTGYHDAAVLYMWPAVWMAFFFGSWGTAFIVGWIGVGPRRGAALAARPSRATSTAGSTSSSRSSSSPSSCSRWPPATSGWSRGSRTRRASTR